MRVMSAVSITPRRGRRSAKTPPTSRKITSGAVFAAITKPRVACGSGQVEHSPCEREQCDRVTEQRYKLSGEEQPELALLERAERDLPHRTDAQEPTHGTRGLHAWSG